MGSATRKKDQLEAVAKAVSTILASREPVYTAAACALELSRNKAQSTKIQPGSIKALGDLSGADLAKLSDVFTLLQNNQKALSAINTDMASDGAMLFRGKNPVNDFYMPMALVLAALRLDKTRKEEGKKQENESLFAALLQDLFALGIIDKKTIEKKFGPSIALLTSELADKTRLPITVTMPDDQGRLSRKQRLRNDEQRGFGADLLYETSDPARAWLIKGVWALQLLRVMRDEKRRIDEVTIKQRRCTVQDAKALETIRAQTYHMGMYATVLGDLNVEFANDIQEIYWKILDEDFYKHVQKKLVDMKLATESGDVVDTDTFIKVRYIEPVKKILDDAGISDSIYRIVTRTTASGHYTHKTVGSIMEKAIRKHNERNFEKGCVSRHINPDSPEANKYAASLRELAWLPRREDGSFDAASADKMLDNIKDYVGLRLVVNSGDLEQDLRVCSAIYEALEQSSNARSENPVLKFEVDENGLRRSKDYISAPKTGTNYRAIHDGYHVMANGEKMPSFEVQIIPRSIREIHDLDHACQKMQLAEQLELFGASRVGPAVSRAKEWRELVDATNYNMAIVCCGADVSPKPYPEPTFAVIYYKPHGRDRGDLVRVTIPATLHEIYSQIDFTKFQSGLGKGAVGGVVLDGKLYGKKTGIESVLNQPVTNEHVAELTFLSEADMRVLTPRKPARTAKGHRKVAPQPKL